MEQRSHEPRSIQLSVRVYRTLLNAYPAEFRGEYGPHMEQVFRDCCLTATRQGGGSAVARLWAITLFDLLRSVIEQTTHKEADMSRSQFVNLSGWGFILGAVAFLSIFQDSNRVTLAGSVISSILLAIGILGLRARYGEMAGGLAGRVLRAGVVGMVLLYVALILLFIIFAALGPVSELEARMNRGSWILLFGGPVPLMLALTVFGLAALHGKAMGRLGWLPILAGAWYPLTYTQIAIYLYTRNGYYPWKSFDPFSDLMYLIQIVAMLALGAVMVSSNSQEPATG